MGFGWDDVNIYKFGVQWQYQPDLAFQAGYSYATDVFKGSQALFNVLAPAVVKRHFSFGLGKKLEGGSEINLAFTCTRKRRCMGQIQTLVVSWTDRPCVYGSMGLEIGWKYRFLIMH